MKNLINVLLYVLLGLLVVTISVMIYKKFKVPTEVATTTDTIEPSFIDSTGSQALPFTAEDSIILGLTGELPSQVGPESDNSMPQTTASVQENISPVAKSVSNHESTSKVDNVVVKSESKTIVKEAAKAVVKTESKASVKASVKKESTKSSNSNTAKSEATRSNGNYYVISGSFLIPSNAEKQVAKLKKLGFFNSTKKVFTNSSSYSAIAGQYETEAAAKASLNKLKAKGEAGFIKKI